MISDALSSPPRLKALEDSGLLNGSRDPEFDRLTRMVCEFMGVDVCLISLVDDQRQHFKSSCGLPLESEFYNGTPLSHSFCQHVVMTGTTLSVPDAAADTLVHDNPAIRDLRVAAYLGVPIHDSRGRVLGSLCAISHTPRIWSDRDKAQLQDFARIVETRCELESKAREAIELAKKKDALAHEYNHRVKNTFALTVSLVRLSSKDAMSAGELAAALQNRMMALADAHNALADAVDGIYLDKLIARLLKPYLDFNSKLNWSGPSVELGSETVTPLCLAIHELATNSAKYGAIKNGESVEVVWSCDGDEVQITWQEQTSYAGYSEPSTHGGFGKNLLRLVARMLDGQADHMYENGILSIKFAFTNELPEE